MSKSRGERCEIDMAPIIGKLLQATDILHIKFTYRIMWVVILIVENIKIISVDFNTKQVIAHALQKPRWHPLFSTERHDQRDPSKYQSTYEAWPN